MKKITSNPKYYVLGAVIIAFILGFCCKAVCSSSGKAAVVDVQQVVKDSPELAAIRQEQMAQNQELQKWLADAQVDIAKQKTDAEKQELQKKYEAELAQKQQAIQSASAQKLQDFDNKLTSLIAEQAKSKGYDIVVAKGLVLYGGTDITQDIAKAINK